MRAKQQQRQTLYVNMAIGSATLYKWVGLYGKIQTTDGEITNNKEIKKMKKEINDLKIENEILKKAIAIFTQK